MTVDMPWFETQVEAYRRELPVYREYARVLEAVLRAAAASVAPMVIVQARPKSLVSFADKILRKRDKYQDPVHQLTDLCGARVIAHTRSDVERLSAFIRRHFEVDEANSLDTAERLRASEFGYRSVHYVVQFHPGVFPTDRVPVEISSELLPRDDCPRKAEIQVRTIAQHTWADIGHDRVYKSPFQVPAPWVRDAARIAALLESADESFGALVARADAYRDNYAAYMSEHQMRDERARLEAVLRCDPQNASLAHRIAWLAVCLEDLDGAIRFIEAFPAADRSAPLWSCLGFARCQIARGNRHGPEYAEGRRDLERALATDPRHVEAILHLADSWAGTDDTKALELYEQAFGVAPNDPRTLAGYVARKIAYERSLAVVAAARPSLEAAVDRCAEQAQLGVNLPSALYWHARRAGRGA